MCPAPPIGRLRVSTSITFTNAKRQYQLLHGTRSTHTISRTFLTGYPLRIHNYYSQHTSHSYLESKTFLQSLYLDSSVDWRKVLEDGFSNLLGVNLCDSKGKKPFQKKKPVIHTYGQMNNQKYHNDHVHVPNTTAFSQGKRKTDNNHPLFANRHIFL